MGRDNDNERERTHIDNLHPSLERGNDSTSATPRLQWRLHGWAIMSKSSIVGGVQVCRAGIVLIIIIISSPRCDSHFQVVPKKSQIRIQHRTMVEGTEEAVGREAWFDPSNHLRPEV